MTNSSNGAIAPTKKQYDPAKDPRWQEVKAELRAQLSKDPTISMDALAKKLYISRDAVRRAMNDIAFGGDCE